MKLIIGLGNPGPQYFNTRHNFGFLALNYFQDSVPGFSPWQSIAKFKAALSEGQIDGEKIILAKPQTFMNLSGQAVKLLADFYKIEPADILVAHDDVDLALGRLRLSFGASGGGHKGVKSIISALGTKDFVRLRLGIKPARQSFLAKLFGRTAKFVLQKFSENEKAPVQTITKEAKEALLVVLKEGLGKAQGQFN